MDDYATTSIDFVTTISFGQASNTSFQKSNNNNGVFAFLLCMTAVVTVTCLNALMSALVIPQKL